MGQGVIQKPFCQEQATIIFISNKKSITNILLCCSIKDENIKGEIFDDLMKYRYISARKKPIYEALIHVGIDKAMLLKCAPRSPAGGGHI